MSDAFKNFKFSKTIFKQKIKSPKAPSHQSLSLEFQLNITNPNREVFFSVWGTSKVSRKGVKSFYVSRLNFQALPSVRWHHFSTFAYLIRKKGKLTRFIKKGNEISPQLPFTSEYFQSVCMFNPRPYPRPSSSVSTKSNLIDGRIWNRSWVIFWPGSMSVKNSILLCWPSA